MTGVLSNRFGSQGGRRCATIASTMARKRPSNAYEFLAAGREALGMSQRDFGLALDASHRTATRWDARSAVPDDRHLRKLAALLYRVDRELAADVASFLRETFVTLGLEAAPPPPAAAPPAPPAPPPPMPPPPPAVGPHDLVDIVVLAAIKHTGMPIEAARELLHVVFKRALAADAAR
jgi:hypothetical protein